MKTCAALLSFMVFALGEAAEPPLLLNTKPMHLRSGTVPEWEEYAHLTPDGPRLDLQFNAQPNTTEATLAIQQNDVRQDWPVELNGRRLGRLFLMEADLVTTFSIPAGTLRAGENQLSIIPPRENDDIFIREVTLYPRDVASSVAEATLELRVRDAADRSPLPCRLTIVNTNGALAALVPMTNSAAGQNPLIAARPGVVYTGDGRARLGLLAGRYTVYASRGFEYSVATQAVHLVAGQTRSLALSLTREVPTAGFVSCDTHVHTFTHSRHGDATIDERMITLAGEGIELPIATDHNLNIDFTEPARRMQVDKYFTPVTGNEVTTPTGHFNIFPVQPEARVPDFTITDWPRLMTALRATPEVRVVVLNHPRNVHSNFQPFAATNFNAASGENKRGAEFSFDAMEVMNSSAQQTDYLLVYRDWFALLNYGYRITAVGSSDGHDVSRYIVGQGRTYIACPDGAAGRLDVSTACSNLVAGRALVSMGLLANMKVDEKFFVGDLATGLGDQVRVHVQVLGPSWVRAGQVELYANGMKVREQVFDATMSQRGGLKAMVNWSLPRSSHDVHLVAIATGPGVSAPFWAIPRPYQPASRMWTNRVIASTNPIWLDADGDGKFTSARGYARELLKKHGPLPHELIPALKNFDEATAVQTASLCVTAGANIASPAFIQALSATTPQTQRGFRLYSDGASPGP